MYQYCKTDMPDPNRYSWERASGDGPPVGRDRKLLHKGEGYEILSIINRAMKLSSTASKYIAQELEAELHSSAMGSTSRSEMLVHLVSFISFNQGERK